MKSECNEIRDLIADSFTEALATGQARQLDEHLRECTDCRRYAEALRREDLLLTRLVAGVTMGMPDRRKHLLQVLGRCQSKQPDGAMSWKRIMKNRIVRLAVAAGIVIAVLLGLHLGSPFGSTVTWAAVREAFLAQAWVHLTYDNGTEQWYDLENGRRYYKNWVYDGGCLSIDEVLNIRQWYVPVYGRHITEDRPTVYKDGVIPPWNPKTAWQVIVGHLEEMAQNGGNEYWEVERHIEQTDAGRTVRFDQYFIDALGRRLLDRQLWASLDTRLPVKVRARLQRFDRKEGADPFFTGIFDFPSEGPSSIFDLGVPRDVPIVKEHEGTADAGVIEVIARARKMREAFPRRYRAITWPAEGHETIEVVYRDGEKIHHDHYFNLVGEPEYSVVLPAGPRDVLEWAITQVPVDVAVYDGERSFIRRNPHPSPSFREHREPEVRVTRSHLLFDSSRPHEQLWPHAGHDPASFGWIENPPKDMESYVGLRIDRADIRRDFYIDPERDYIYVKWIWWKQKEGTWTKEREYEHLDFVRLPEGQWYATRRRLTTYPDPDKGTVGHEVNWLIHVEPLDEGDYPPDTFNGDKLLEGAGLR